MNTAESVGRQTPVPGRSENVILGRQNYLSVLFRLIGGELFKIERRLLFKILGLLALFLIIAVFGLYTIPALITKSQPANRYLPPSCTAVDPNSGQQCLDHAPTAQDLKQAQETQAEQIRAYSDLLRLPTSYTFAGQVAQALGIFIFIILGSTIIGGEYATGTIRLALTRGPTRTQFLLAKIGTILVCIIIGMIVAILVGVLTGTISNLLIGVPNDFSFFTTSWLWHAFLFFLILIVGVFVFSVLALTLANLGKNTAAGVAGGIVWWVLESTLGGILGLIGQANKGTALGDFLSAVPNYFMGNNISALLQNQTRYLQPGTVTSSLTPTISDLHAVIVLAVYILVFLGISLWINAKRDITS